MSGQLRIGLNYTIKKIKKINIPDYSRISVRFFG